MEDPFFCDSFVIQRTEIVGENSHQTLLAVARGTASLAMTRLSQSQARRVRVGPRHLVTFAEIVHVRGEAKERFKFDLNEIFILLKIKQ
jgi:hypothetical protein